MFKVFGNLKFQDFLIYVFNSPLNFFILMTFFSSSFIMNVKKIERHYRNGYNSKLFDQKESFSVE